MSVPTRLKPPLRDRGPPHLRALYVSWLVEAPRAVGCNNAALGSVPATSRICNELPRCRMFPRRRTGSFVGVISQHRQQFKDNLMDNAHNLDLGKGCLSW